MSELASLLHGFRAYVAARDDADLTRFVAAFDWHMPSRRLDVRSLPVVDHLAQATASAVGREAALLHALLDAAPSLRWAQTYNADDFGDLFLQRYGWTELFGGRGAFESDVMAGGFLMLGPEIHYPDHHHLAEEIYIPLTGGSFWSKDGGAFNERRAGEIIHHPSDVRHAMKTQGEALVALYLWRGGPLAQKSTISGRRT